MKLSESRFAWKRARKLGLEERKRVFTGSCPAGEGYSKCQSLSYRSTNFRVEGAKEWRYGGEKNGLLHWITTFVPQSGQTRSD